MRCLCEIAIVPGPRTLRGTGDAQRRSRWRRVTGSFGTRGSGRAAACDGAASGFAPASAAVRRPRRRRPAGSPRRTGRPRGSRTARRGTRPVRYAVSRARAPRTRRPAPRRSRARVARAAQRGHHGRAGREAVVDDDHDAPGRIDRRADRRTARGAGASSSPRRSRGRGSRASRRRGPRRRRRSSSRSSTAPIANSGNWGRILRVSIDVEVAAERVGDDLAHRHRPARIAQTKRVGGHVPRRELPGDARRQSRSRKTIGPPALPEAPRQAGGIRRFCPG